MTDNTTPTPIVAVLEPTGPRIVPIDSLVLRADDQAASRGDGAFETMHIRPEGAWQLDSHLDRMFRTAAKLGITPPPREALAAVTNAAVREWQRITDAEGGVKLVCSRGPEFAPKLGPTAYAMAFPVAKNFLHQRREGANLVSLTFGYSADVRSQAPWLLGAAKTLSYAVNMAALRHAANTGYDDVLLTSSDGYALEGPTSTLVWAVGGSFFTTPTDTGILPGTTVAYLFDHAAELGMRAGERLVKVADLYEADSVWIMSSVRGAAIVNSIDGKQVRRGELAEQVNTVLGFTAPETS